MNSEINKGLESVSDAWHSVTENVGEGLSDYVLAIRLQVMQALWIFFFGVLSISLLAVAGVAYLSESIGLTLAVSCLCVLGAVLFLGLAGNIILKSLRPADPTLIDSTENPHAAEVPTAREARNEFVSGVRDIRRGVIKAISPIEIVRRNPLISSGLLTLAGVAVGAGFFSTNTDSRISRLRRKVAERRSSALDSFLPRTEKNRAVQQKGYEGRGGMGSQVVAMLLPLVVSKLKDVALEKGRSFFSSGDRSAESQSRQVDVAADPGQRSTVAIPRSPAKSDDRYYVQ